jgi:hypothetical protein
MGLVVSLCCYDWKLLEINELCDTTNVGDQSNSSELTATRYWNHGRVTRSNSNCRSWNITVTWWCRRSCVCPRCGYTCAGKDVCPVCRCVWYACYRSVQLDLERSIISMTGCHWRREDGVVERVEPLDDVARSATCVEKITSLRSDTNTCCARHIKSRLLRLSSSAAEVWRIREGRVIEDSGRVDRDIASSGSVRPSLFSWSLVEHYCNGSVC